MTEIAVETTTYLSTNRSWLLDDWKMARISGIIDFTKFTANTHYPNGFLPAGLNLGRLTAGGKFGPYSDAASDGTQTNVGLLYNDVKVPADLTRPVQVVLIDSFAIVTVAKLPANHGLDANGRADLPLIKFR